MQEDNGGREEQDLLLFREEDEDRANGSKWRLPVLIGIVAVVVVVILVVALSGRSEGNVSQDTNVFANGISIMGTDVSGMTMEEASSVLEGRAQELADGLYVDYLIQDAAYTITGEQAHASYDYADVMQEAFAYGKSGDADRDGADLDILENSGLNFEAPLVTDREAVLAEVSAHSALEQEADASQVILDKSADEQALATSYSVSFGEGAPILEVDAEALADGVIMEMEKGSHGPLDAHVREVQAAVSPEEAEQSFKLRGSYVTSLGAAQEDDEEEDTAALSDERLYNIWRGSDLLNTIAILPGQEWSAKEALGAIDEQSGFKLAEELAGEEETEAAGGGLNQLISTVYAAALNAEIEVASRSRLAWPAEYIPAGLDADIFADGADLVLKNQGEQPLYLVVECDAAGKNLEASWFGTPFEDGLVRNVASEVTETEAAGDAERISNDELAAGTSNVIREAHDGVRAAVSRILTDAEGNESSRTELYVDEYAAYAQITEVGPTPAATARPTRRPTAQPTRTPTRAPATSAPEPDPTEAPATSEPEPEPDPDPTENTDTVEIT